jgi:hypothetical protein
METIPVTASVTVNFLQDDSFLNNYFILVKTNNDGIKIYYG